MDMPQENEAFTLVMQREFDAPRELVFNAFIDPDQLAAWFGPVGVDTPRDRITVEPRVGGAWNMVMVYEEGGVRKESPVTSAIEEFDPPQLLSTVEAVPDSGDGTPNATAMRLEFQDVGGRTLLKLTQTGFTNEEWVDLTRNGWESSFTILDKQLAVSSDTAS